MNDSDVYLLCPYCCSRIAETAVVCTVCEGDVTRDAPLELTRDEYAAEPRKVCRHCAAEMLALAVRCPTCRKKQ